MMDDFIRGRNVVRRIMVAPTTLAARTFETELNHLDAAFFLVPDVPVVWVWKHMQLDFERLRMGLQRALNRIPSVAGRVRAGNRRMVVSNVNSEGCVLVLQRDRRLPNEDCHSSIWTKYGEPETLIPSEPIDVPLLAATLTLFDEGGCSLHVRFSHVLMDGCSMVTFMQMWSYETGMAFYSPEVIKRTIPSQNPPQPQCSHVLPEKRIPLSKEDMDQRLGVFRTLRFFANVMKNKVMDEVADFELELTSWEELKRKVKAGAPQEARISSYETLMGLILHCMAKTEGKDTIDARAVVNLRDRSELFGKDYFGVGLSIHEAESLPITNCVADTALALHVSLRQALRDTTEMEKLIKLTEHFEAIETGLLSRVLDGRELAIHRARFLTVWENCIALEKCVINSWVGYPWLDMNFGLPGGDASRPDYMRVPPDFRFHRHVHIAPITNTRFQLRMQLSSSLMARFREELAKTGFPFREITLDKGVVNYNSIPRIATRTKAPGGFVPNAEYQASPRRKTKYEREQPFMKARL